MWAFSQLIVLAFLAQAAVAANDADRRYAPALGLSDKGAMPGEVPPTYSPPIHALPAVLQYPPSWHYNPYTQGVVPLPQGGGE